MVEGVLNIDKPLGLTSHDVVARVRRLAGTRRVGHAGTLDPLATGVLVVCVGRATRLVEYVVGQEKGYTAVVRLGVATNTYDAEGEVTAEAPLPEGLDVAMLETHLAVFRGEIEQVPPLYSAIKKNGQPLYKLARRGETVALAARPVSVYALELVAWEPPLLRLAVRCGAGTYIRSLAHDLGVSLGCGGHLAGLRRTAVGRFALDGAVELDRLTVENVGEHAQAMDAAVAHLPCLAVTAEQAADLRYGRFIEHEHLPEVVARAYAPAGDFVGMVRFADGVWRPKKIFPEAGA